MPGHNTTDLSNRFTDQSFFRALPPELIAAFSLALGDMADALVMGQSMGATGLAAVSLALPVFMVINIFMHGLGAGGSVHFSKLLGSGKYREAKKSFSHILQGTVFLGIVLAVLGNIFLNPLMLILGTSPQDGVLYQASSTYVRIIISGIPIFFTSYLLNYYLRNDDNQKLASLGFTIGNASDLILNIVLVFILEMGVMGAAVSTIIGQTISLGIYLIGIFSRKSDNLSYKPQKPSPKAVLSCFRIGFSTSIQYLYQMIFLLSANNILMRNLGEEGVAVFDVLQNVSYILMYMYEGVAKAGQPLISTFCGEHNHTGIKRIKRLSLICSTLTGMLLCFLVCIFSGTICTVFGLDGAELIKLGSHALSIYCIGLVFAGVSVILEGYYQSQEDERSAVFLVTMRSAAILLPCTFLFSLLNIDYFWWLFPCTEILSLIVFFIRTAIVPKKKTDPEPSITSIITGKSADISKLTEKLEQFCERQNATSKQTYYVMLSVEEVCLALIEKAFPNPEDCIIQVTVVACKDGNFDVYLRDNAIKFNVFSLASSEDTLTDSSSLNSIGMTVIKKKAKEFFYRNYRGFNTLYIKI